MAREKTERLLNLMIALSSTSRPVSREELRTWLLDQYGADQSPEAFEKMFERDKDELRGMGIPIETVLNAHNEVAGYRIENSKLKMTELNFNKAEIAVLNMAAAFWASANASSPTRSAILKLEATTGAILKQSPSVMAVGTQFHEGLIGDLLEAVREQRVVSFDYTRSDGTQLRRFVSPWGVVSREGHWYLVGFDEDRRDERVFRLSRIHGSVQREDQTSNPAPKDVDLARLIGTAAKTHTATIHVSAGMAPELRRRTGIAADIERFDVSYDSIGFLIRDVLRYAPHAYIVAPIEARTAFMNHLSSLIGTQS